MKPITYIFRFEGDAKLKFVVSGEGFDEKATRAGGETPPWTQLKHHQCANCPLRQDEYMYCPVAVDFAGIAGRFENTLSHKPAELWIISEDRTYFKMADVQTGLRSLYEVVMARSTCPVLKRTRPVAESHYPFATAEESMRQAVGAYLLKLLLEEGEGGNGAAGFDLEAFRALYRDLEVVIGHLFKRISSASLEDANLNALSGTLMTSSLIANSLDDMLDDIREEYRQGF